MEGRADPRRIVGKRGEELAAEYLRRRGYRIHETNFRCRFGELDIVASEGDTLVFVEVRARSGSAFGSAEESVTPRKQRKLSQVAEAYLQARYQPGSTDGGRTAASRRKERQGAAAEPPVAAVRSGEVPNCRIDVVVIALAQDGAVERIELIRDAVRQ